jgi:hypothetical protein
MMDYRLWKDRNRLSNALSGIFEVRELPDLTLAGFSNWEENGKFYWAHVLFNRKNQLLSVVIHPESEIESLMDRGVAVWKESEQSHESPVTQLKLASADLLMLSLDQSVA